MINQFVRAWVHSFIYDKGTLPDLLTEAGFVNITEREPGESPDPRSPKPRTSPQDIFPNPALNEIETMVFEATKPG